MNLRALPWIAAAPAALSLALSCASTPRGARQEPSPAAAPTAAAAGRPSAPAVTFTRLWAKTYGTGSETAELSPDGSLAAIGVQEGRSVSAVHLVRTADGSLVKRLPYVDDCTGKKCNEIESMAFSPDGKLLAVGGNDKPVRVIDVETGVTRLERRTKETDGMRASPDGRFFAIADHGQVLIVALPSLEVRTLPAHKCGINSIDFSADARLMVTGSCDHSAIVWDTRDFTKRVTIATPDSVKTARLTPDGRYALFACGASNKVVLHETDGRKVGEVDLSAHVDNPDRYLDHAEFAPDGRTFVTQGKGQDLLVFSVPALEPIARVPSTQNGEYMHWRKDTLLVVSSKGEAVAWKTSSAAE